MRLSDFNFELPEKLIALYPLKERTASRMLCLDGNSGSVIHSQFTDLAQRINPGDLLVFNNTLVMQARLFGTKISGGKVEILIERLLPDNQALAQIRASKAPKTASIISLEDNTKLKIIGRKENLFVIEADNDLLQVMEAIGHIPLPPYINRPDDISDHQRYQTVYGEHKGAVAAPTAGLHFSESMIEKLEKQGVETAFVTLHVGAGTFQPVRVDDIEQHHMHSEYYEVTKQLIEQVIQTKQRGGKIIAVGTTSVRCLESAASSGQLEAYAGETNIFIYPGYEFKVVDSMITNFHLPESTLIMLVSAFAGREHILNAYQQAIEEKYRFFSYGDAMFITKAEQIIHEQTRANVA